MMVMKSSIAKIFNERVGYFIMETSNNIFLFNMLIHNMFIENRICLISSLCCIIILFLH